MTTLFASVGLQGMPTPAPEVVERLTRIDSHLGIRWIHELKCWAMTWTWKDTDPRRQMIQAGEMSPADAWDAIGYAPAEMPIEDAFAMLERNLRVCDRDYGKQLIDNIHNWNKARSESIVEDTIGEQLNEIEVRGARLFESTGASVPKVYNAGVPKPLKPVKKATTTKE
jgi:hypothetical protein